jgi:hypothetical protein
LGALRELLFLIACFAHGDCFANISDHVNSAFANTPDEGD